MLQLQNIDEAKARLNRYDPLTFSNVQDSFRHFINEIEVEDFRHIHNLKIHFSHPITVITGTNKIGKTSLLLLLACSHHDFKRFDSTKPEPEFRRHTWRDVLSFTNYKNVNRNYGYKLKWRIGPINREGEAKRLASSQAWTGVGKASSDPQRINAQIKGKEVRLIDLERLLPARNFSNSLLRKIASAGQIRVHADIEQAFSYILGLPTVEICQIGAHINKTAYLITYGSQPYSSFNAASGEEALINILVDIVSTPPNSLILIDEMEAGFHPQVQRKLAEIIQYISWIHKKQFVITTHSPSLLAAFHQKSRKFIDKKSDGTYLTIPNISVNAAFSKMDSISYPLLQLYCEDDIAEFIIRNILIEINRTNNYFDRLINIIRSGAVNEVYTDYIRHKKHFNQLRLKVGYCCIFDGDYKNDSRYSSYHENPEEFSFFLYPYEAPEKFLVKAYLQVHENAELLSAFTHSDHHALFLKMVNLGLAVDEPQALRECWEAFKNTPEYSKLAQDLKAFLIRVTKHFSDLSD